VHSESTAFGLNRFALSTKTQRTAHRIPTLVAGISGRQTRGPVRTPEPQFIVAPEEEGEPEGEGQESGRHRDGAKSVHPGRPPDDGENGTDGARDEAR